jgi:hypothetical protein
MTSLAQKQLIETDLDDQIEDDSETSETGGEEPEPPRLEDEGDSDWWLTDQRQPDRFQEGPRPPLRTITDLPYEARPLVRYWIDHEFNVHKLDRRRRPNDVQSQRRDLIALAVALHLRQEGCTLHEAGAWCQVPRIKGDQGLLELVNKVESITDDLGLRRLGKALKSFAIMLPNGDVITVQALLDEARKKKRATRAAALRLAESRPFELAGDLWSAKDWRRFEINQRQAAEEDEQEGDSP